MTPAAQIATTVARAMAERGDDVGPNVTLVLLAELEDLADRVVVAEGFARSQSDREFELLAVLEARDQRIRDQELTIERLRKRLRKPRPWRGL